MVVDSYLRKDPYARVACETLTTTNKIVLAGEFEVLVLKEMKLLKMLEIV